MTQNPFTTEAIIAAERAVIGSCLIAPERLRDLDLDLDHFVHLPHRAVFSAMRNLEAEQRPIDVLSVEMQLSREGKLDAVGGIEKLIDISLAPPLVQHVDEYAWSVRDAALKRRIAMSCAELLERAKDPTVAGDELLGSATAKIGALDGTRPESVETIGDLARRCFDDLERFAQEQAAGRVVVTGAPTGVKLLDECIGGWQFGIVNLLAARPGMGKSSLALATADACSACGLGTHVFSLEDSWRSYTERQYARLSLVPAIRIRRGHLGREEVGKLTLAKRQLEARKGWIVDHRGGLSAREIVRCVRRNAEKNGTRVVVVDYVQLVRPHDSRAREDQQLGDTVGTFAEAAKADDMAYVVCSQFNRELEKRPDRRPVLSDLRGSGELEEKCKLAIGLYRGAYYQNAKPKREVDWECDCREGWPCTHVPDLADRDDCDLGAECRHWSHQVQCIVLKGGNGPVGRVFAKWHGPTVRIL